MNKITQVYLLLIGFTIGLWSCKQKNRSLPDATYLQNDCVHDLTDIIVYDIFSPPVSSRIYAYCNLAYYEALKYKSTSNSSLTLQLKGFSPLQINLPEKINYDLAAIHAFFTTAKALIFSKDSITKRQSRYDKMFKTSLDKITWENSIALANTISGHILKRAGEDNYKLTRGMPRYSTYTGNDLWQQTPPDYADALEPNWKLIKPLFLDAASQFNPIPPPPYSIEKNSAFYKEMLEVYDVSKTRLPEMDTIAQFWDDNPFVTKHKGHFTFATKKTTPVGHWMGILSILSKKQKLQSVESAWLYASSSVAIFDAFISCWDEKYKSKKLRPVTAIRNLIDENWEPMLQTPPFPEYTSGHSVISSAVAVIIENSIGKNISFTDTTEKEFLGLVRSFSGIQQAADEAGMSRLYGGIHFLSAITEGKKQGVAIGNYFISKIKK